MKIAIIGCGWLGQRLAKYFTDRHHTIIVTTTSPEKLEVLKKISAEVHLLDFSKDFNAKFLESVEIAIFSMPVSRNSWFDGFSTLKASFSKTMFFSSTGIYPVQDGLYTEQNTENLREDIVAAENLVKTKYLETIILRLGGLMGDDRSLHHFYADRQPPDPEKKVNYIHFEDISAMVEILLTAENKNQVYNFVAPEHPTIAEVLDIKKQQNKKPLNENSGRIISSELFIKEFNYKFIHPNPQYF
jgi:nucleoside-diphosphate-sugar epimerase